MIQFEKPDRPVNRVFIHCSASDNPEHDDVNVIRGWHINQRGWSDVGYHFFIQKNGNIQKGRGLERIPAAQAGNNTDTIAICLHGLAVENFTLSQYGSLCYLCDRIDQAYLHNVSFHGHKEVANKDCPVIDYKALLHLDSAGGLWNAKSLRKDAGQIQEGRDV